MDSTDKQQAPQDNPENRSEGLLPGGPGGADAEDQDGNDRYEVAEEMNLDQQSDAVRHLGNLPEDGGKTAEAMAETLGKDDQAGQGAR